MTQLEMGVKVEQEHLPTYNWLIDYITENDDFPDMDEFAKHISLDHLSEVDKYYTILDDAGL